MYDPTTQDGAIAPIADVYERDGFVSPARLISGEEATGHRRALEAVEAQHGSMHYVSKVHTILDFAADLATQPRVLDSVEEMIGPVIMLFDVTYIMKEPNTDSHVSWHQDLIPTACERDSCGIPKTMVI